MPVASPLAPKSILRHRPLNQASTTGRSVPVARASRSGQIQEPVPPCMCVTSQQTTSQEHTRWLVWFGVGMLVALAAVLLGQLVVGWITTSLDDWHYGRPRTFQCDAVVGHAD